MQRRLAVPLGLSAFALPAAWVLADAGYASYRGWRPEGWVSETVIAIAVLAAGLIFTTILIAPLRRLVKTHWAELLTLGITLLAGLAASELVFRQVGPPPDPPFHLSTPNYQLRIELAEWNRTDDETYTLYTTNSMGIRGPELSESDTLRILCVGGSTTQCLNLDDRRTWTHWVMEGLNAGLSGESVWVGAAGYPGFRSLDHLKFLKSFETLEEFDVALFLIGVNDLNIAVTKEIIIRNLRAQRLLALRTSNAHRPLWTKLALYSYVNRAAQIHALKDDPFVEEGRPENVQRRRERRAHAEIVTDAPHVPEALEAYRVNVRGIIEQCRERGIVPVFATQPTVWADDLPAEVDALLWMGEVEEGTKFLAVPQLRAYMDQFNTALKEVCAELNVLCIELTALDGNVELFVDDCHFNNAGAKAVADILVESLITELPRMLAPRP